MLSTRQLLLGLGALALAFAAVGCSGNGGDTIVQTNGASGISASGTGEATAAPDLAIVTLGVQVDADTVAEARDTAAQAMQAVIDSIKGNGVADEDVQTVQLSIYPRYDYRNDGQQVLLGYSVSNAVTVRIRDIDNTSKVIDDAAEAGGDPITVQGISFSIDDPTELQTEARDAAVKQARARAEELAQSAGVDLGELLSISEGFNNVVPIFESGRGGAAFDAAASTPIETGELTVSVTVNILYAID